MTEQPWVWPPSEVAEIPSQKGWPEPGDPLKDIVKRIPAQEESWTR